MDQDQSLYLKKLRFDPKQGRSFIAKYLGNFRLALLIIITILAYGLFGYINLPRRINPEVEIPIIFVSTVLPGGSPGDIESLISVPLEDAVSGIEKVATVNTTSLENVSMMTIEFDADVKVEDAADEVNGVIEGVVLPEDARDPQVIALDLEDVPVWSFAVTGEQDMATMISFADELKEKLEEEETVNKVIVSGLETQEVQVLIDSEKLLAYQINPIQIQQQLAEGTASFPGGAVSSNGSTYTLTIDPLITTVDDIRNIKLRLQNQIYSLGDIATVSERSSPNQAKSFYSDKYTAGQRAVSFGVYKTRGANIDTAAKAAKEVVNNYNRQFGDRFQLVSILDFDKEIGMVFDDLFDDFTTSILLVFTTLFLFLGLRQAAIASLVIPISFLFTFGFMQSMGLTLSFISLFSLLLAQGMIVDDTIVIISAMTDYFRTKRFTPLQSGVLVWNDFIVPILTSNLTNIWSFLPLLLATGIIGEFIRVIPIVVITALIGSTAISLMVTLPLMVQILDINIPRRVRLLLQLILAAAITAGVTWLYRDSYLFLPILVSLVLTAAVAMLTWKQNIKTVGKRNRQTVKLLDRGVFNLNHPIAGYRELLVKVLGSASARRKVITAVLLFSLFSYALVPLGLVQNEFFPKTDQNVIYTYVELPVGTSLQQTTKETVEIVNKFRDIPEIKYVISEVGAQAEMGSVAMQTESHRIRYSVALTDLEERKKTSSDIVTEIRNRLGDYDKGRVFVSEPSAGPPSGADLQIKLLGDDLGVLNEKADETMAYLDSLEGVRNIDKSIKPGIGKLTFNPDMRILNEQGISLAQVGGQIRMFASGLPMGSVKLDNDEREMVLRLSNQLQTPESLNRITLTTPLGAQVPLSSLGNWRLEANPTQITREDMVRFISVTAAVDPGFNIPALGKQLEIFADGELNLGEGYSWKTGGVNEENQKSVNSILQSMAIAAILIAGTMVLQLKSFRQALIVMLVIPLAVSGVFILFSITGTPLSFPALIGILALFGIVVKNSILIVDKINQNLEIGIPFKEAIADGAGSRLEPIIFSSITNFIGLLPITISDPLWRGLGGAIISGLLFSGTITLIFIPVVYYIWMKPAGLNGK